MRKVLIIGHRGQLGSDLRKVFAGDSLALTTQQELRVEDAAQVDAVAGEFRPDLVLNCSAFHRVDDCS